MLLKRLFESLWPRYPTETNLLIPVRAPVPDPPTVMALVLESLPMYPALSLDPLSKTFESGPAIPYPPNCRLLNLYCVNLI